MTNYLGNKKMVKGRKPKKVEYPPIAKKYRWGIFRKGGWKCLGFYDTKEECERVINNYGDYAKLYETRELHWGKE